MAARSCCGAQYPKNRVATSACRLLTLAFAKIDSRWSPLHTIREDKLLRLQAREGLAGPALQHLLQTHGVAILERSE
jgi:hypothetical protein